jgi:hypothetical protein
MIMDDRLTTLRAMADSSPEPLVRAWAINELFKFNEHHDEHGRFAESDGPSRADTRLWNRVEKQGGFTNQPFSGENPKTGFALSLFPEREEAIKCAEFDPGDIHTYIGANKDALKQEGNYLGAWHDVETGIVYLDVSKITPSADEAFRLCQQYSQEGYYDLGTTSTVITKDEAERRRTVVEGVQGHG